MKACSSFSPLRKPDYEHAQYLLDRNSIPRIQRESDIICSFLNPSNEIFLRFVQKNLCYKKRGFPNEYTHSHTHIISIFQDEVVDLHIEKGESQKEKRNREKKI